LRQSAPKSEKFISRIRGYCTQNPDVPPYRCAVWCVFSSPRPSMPVAPLCLQELHLATEGPTHSSHSRHALYPAQSGSPGERPRSATRAAVRPACLRAALTAELVIERIEALARGVVVTRGRQRDSGRAARG
jgi:hypothetical protein